MACRAAVIGAVFGALFAALFAAGPAHAQGLEPSGVWLTQAGDAKVRVSKCGGGICGVIVWLREPIDSATGKPATDNKNPNPALAARPMISLPLFSSMQPSGLNRWSGEIYNADDGNMYASHIALTDAGSLRVEGCRDEPSSRFRATYATIAFNAVAAEA